MDNKITLAFADDNLLHQKVVELMALEMGKFEILFLCKDGKELIQKLQSSSVLPQVCILDLHMPTMDGMATAKELSRQFPQIKLIGYSASESFEEKMSFMESGVRFVFSKKSPRRMLNSAYYYTKLCENLEIFPLREAIFLEKRWNRLSQI